MPEPSPEDIDTFIEKWSHSGGHERGAGHQFLLEFCDLLVLPRPDPPVANNELNTYTFERRVDRKKPDGTTAPNWIDLYKAAYFVLETKQGVNRLRDKSSPDQPLLPSLDAATAQLDVAPGEFDKLVRERTAEIDQELLTRLVALNHERAAEEKRGLIRWLRPEYQTPDQATLPKEEQKEIELKAEKAGTAAATIPDGNGSPNSKKGVTRRWMSRLRTSLAGVAACHCCFRLVTASTMASNDALNLLYASGSAANASARARSPSDPSPL